MTLILFVSPAEGRITRQLSTDSVSSINSLSSACSTASQQSAATDGEAGRRKKKKGWVSVTVLCHMVLDGLLNLILMGLFFFFLRYAFFKQ